jgi:hypothetical protein
MRKAGIGAIATLFLSGCLGDIGTDGGSWARGAMPLATGAAIHHASQNNDGDYNQPGKREVHYVATREDCDRMARRFELQGRKISLVEKSINNLPTGKINPLKWKCVFEGEDAGDSTFDDHRYNSPDEYNPEPKPYESPSIQPNPRTPYRGNPGQRRFRESRRRDFKGW